MCAVVPNEKRGVCPVGSGSYTTCTERERVREMDIRDSKSTYRKERQSLISRSVAVL